MKKLKDKYAYTMILPNYNRSYIFSFFPLESQTPKKAAGIIAIKIINSCKIDTKIFLILEIGLKISKYNMKIACQTKNTMI